MNLTKQQIRQFYASIKPNKAIYNDIKSYINMISLYQQDVINSFSIDKVHISKYDLPFRFTDFVNAIASYYYKGRIGRRLKLLVYYDNIPIGIIEYASPVMSKPLNIFLKQNYDNYDFNLLNKILVEVSVCVGFGQLTKFLSGKLIILCAMSTEVVQKWNVKYNTDIKYVYTTSIFGKSSIYNRVRNLKYIGMSQGMHSALTSEQTKLLYKIYKEKYPHRKITLHGYGSHLIRLYDHLLRDGVELPFTINPMPRGAYICDKILPLQDNLQYWYERWFVPRRQRILQ